MVCVDSLPVDVSHATTAKTGKIEKKLPFGTIANRNLYSDSNQRTRKLRGGETATFRSSRGFRDRAIPPSILLLRLLSACEDRVPGVRRAARQVAWSPRDGTLGLTSDAGGRRFPMVTHHGRDPYRREGMRRLFIGLVVAATTVVFPVWALAANQEVAEQIAANLRKGGQLHDYKIGVKFQDGTAWLQGRVADQDQLKTVLEVVSRTEGVRRVVNKLTVGPPKPRPPPRRRPIRRRR